ncbi:hypothetical protein [Nocardia sp. NPDC057440]|uniref:hypothetical protein n=1 Tax=Nocardia sp. NPDC057440 TaxID=3346134 RepID=UPI00366FC39C
MPTVQPNPRLVLLVRWLVLVSPRLVLLVRWLEQPSPRPVQPNPREARSRPLPENLQEPPIP